MRKGFGLQVAGFWASAFQRVARALQRVGGWYRMGFTGFYTIFLTNLGFHNFTVKHIYGALYGGRTREEAP